MGNQMQRIVDFLWGPEPIIAIQQALGAGWAGFFSTLTLVGNTQGIVLLVAATILLGARRAGYYILGTTLLALALTSLIWQVLHVPRPSDPRIVTPGPKLPTPSYPSGHASMVVALWGPLAAKGPLLAFLAVALIAAVALSRLYLGYHYLGDMLAGLLIGFVVLAVFPGLWAWFAPAARSWPWWIFMTAGLITTVAAAGYLLFGPSHQAEEAGLVAAAGLGLPLEYRFIQLRSQPGSFRQRLLLLALGLGPVILLLAAEMLTNQTWPVVSFLLALLAGLWALLGAPLLFVRFQLARSDAEPPARWNWATESSD